MKALLLMVGLVGALQLFADKEGEEWLIQQIMEKNVLVRGNTKPVLIFGTHNSANETIKIGKTSIQFDSKKWKIIVDAKKVVTVTDTTDNQTYTFDKESSIKKAIKNAEVK